MVRKRGGRGLWLGVGLAATVVLVIAYAWIDGGREPMRTIRQPVATPEAQP